MKLCKSCLQEKPLNEFYTNGKYRGQTKYKPTCKICELMDKRDSYIRFLKGFYGEWKCQKCGFKGHPSQFDCHHRNPLEKEFSVSRAFSKVRNSPKKFKEELKKCDLLCSNCHRLVHVKYGVATEIDET